MEICCVIRKHSWKLAGRRFCTLFLNTFSVHWDNKAWPSGCLPPRMHKGWVYYLYQFLTWIMEICCVISVPKHYVAQDEQKYKSCAIFTENARIAISWKHQYRYMYYSIDKDLAYWTSADRLFTLLSLFQTLSLKSLINYVFHISIEMWNT